MKLLLLLIVGASICSYAKALDCYSCMSYDSWEKCEKKLAKITCPPELDSCAKGYAKAGTTKVFVKGCETSKECNHKDICGAIPGATECEVSCCDSDLCNGSPGIGASVFVLIASALLACLCAV